jgi:hypothetical protein
VGAYGCIGAVQPGVGDYQSAPFNDNDEFDSDSAYESKGRVSPPVISEELLGFSAADNDPVHNARQLQPDTVDTGLTNVRTQGAGAHREWIGRDELLYKDVHLTAAAYVAN